MFGFKSKKVDVLSHWYVPVPSFNASTAEFYAAVEKELQEQKVPGLEISRLDFSEGGLLSDKRVYLRMTRERLVFDICAAPFGTNYFYSCRFAELPVKVSLLAIAILLFAPSGIIVGRFEAARQSPQGTLEPPPCLKPPPRRGQTDRKSTRLNSSHLGI